MKHAGPATLDALDALLAELRGIAGLQERSRGVFYRKSKAFLHFHEDPSGIHADLRIGDGFVRYRVESAAERRALLARVRRAVAPPTSASARHRFPS